MSTPWLLGRRKQREGKKARLHRTILKKENSLKRGPWRLLDRWQKFGRIQSNRPVSWINCKVNSRIFLLISSEKSLLPYINSCVKTSLEGLMSPNGRTNARTPARDLVVGCQKMDRATKNVPHPQYHRLRGTLGL